MQNHQADTRNSRPLAAPASILGLARSEPGPARVQGGADLIDHPVRPDMLAHDARNLITALATYSELLALPGVLSSGFAHYAGDLNRLAVTGSRLIEALAGAAVGHASGSKTIEAGVPPAPLPYLRRRPFPLIEDLGAELHMLEGSLRALAGPEVRVEIDSMPCAGRIGLSSEDLFRVLFNLIANAVEAFAATPAELRRHPVLRITALRGGAASFLARSKGENEDDEEDTPGAETVVLSVRDNGPGIAAKDLLHIFEEGFSTRRSPRHRRQGGFEERRGLGLAIVRQLVGEAGGAVRAVSPRSQGTRFDLELPVLDRRPSGRPLQPALVPVRRKIAACKQISAPAGKEA